MELKRAIPFRRYNQETAHKKRIGPGRYPKKVAKHVLQVLTNAEANAEYEGLDTDGLSSASPRARGAGSRRRTCRGPTAAPRRGTSRRPTSRSSSPSGGEQRR